MVLFIFLFYYFSILFILLFLDSLFAFFIFFIETISLLVSSYLNSYENVCNLPGSSAIRSTDCMILLTLNFVPLLTAVRNIATRIFPILCLQQTINVTDQSTSFAISWKRWNLVNRVFEVERVTKFEKMGGMRNKGGG